MYIFLRYSTMETDISTAQELSQQTQDAPGSSQGSLSGTSQTLFTPEKGPSTRTGIVGFVHNLGEVRNDKFEFQFQTKEKTLHVQCFSPNKRRELEEKEKSPVCLKKIRKSASSENYIFPEQGEIEITEADFTAAEISGTVEIKNVAYCAEYQIVNVSVKVFRVHEDTNKGEAVYYPRSCSGRQKWIDKDCYVQ